MSWISRLSNLFRPQLTYDLDDELSFHVEARTRDNIERGLPPEAARRDALLRFGQPLTVRERTRDMDIMVWAESLGQDLRYAFRGLRRNPGFTAVALLALALGVGANTAIFAIVHGVLLRPLPFPESGRLQMLTVGSRRGSFPVSPGLADSQFLEFRRINRTFESLTWFASNPTTLTGAGDPVRLSAVQATPNFWQVLRVLPMIGRSPLPSESAASLDRMVILSNGLWRTRFAADPGIAGKPITLDGVERRVAGVMPPGFAFPAKADLWMPREVVLDSHNSFTAPVVGRLRPGVTPRQAEAELRSYASSVDKRYNTADGVVMVQPVKELLVGNVRNSLLVFAGAVGFVMLIACVNFANLLLIRATSRHREIAARAALGAGRPRLIRQLLTESTLLSLLGGAGGILLAYRAVPLLLALAPAGRIPRAEEIRIDGPVLLFGLGVSLLTGILFGIAPALQATRGQLRESLTQASQNITGRHEGLRATLAAAEIGLALILVTGAGLLLQSFIRMRAVDPGFDPGSVLSMLVMLPDSVYRESRAMQSFHQRMIQQLNTIPGITAAGSVNWMPFGGASVRGDFVLEGSRSRPRGYVVDKCVVSPGYFRAMGIRLLDGRDFTPQDSASSDGVLVISQSAAKSLWPNESALGKRLSMQDHPKPKDWLTVVGIVNDVRQNDLTGRPSHTMYQTIPQVTSKFFLSQMTYVVRTGMDPRQIAPAMREVLRYVDPNQPSQAIAPAADLLAAATAEPRFEAWLIGSLSLLALLLAAIGVYGVLACAVAERTREIGIRMALGAARADVIRMVLRRTMIIAVAGVAVGSAGALALTRVLDKLLFDIKPGDPATFLAGAVLLTVVALIAALLPARRAAGVDPLLTIRYE